MKIIVVGLIFITSIFFVSCTDSNKSKKEGENSSVESILNNVAQKIKDIENEVKESFAKIMKDSSRKGTQIIQDAQNSVSQKMKNVKGEFQQKTTQIEKKAQEIINSASLNLEAQLNKGAKIYIKCSSCHGIKGEKSALNNSKIIQGWKKQKTIDALNGYKNGTYGYSMKTLMKSEVINLSNQEIKEVAKYIEQLK